MKNYEKGFTLVELLGVIVILSIIMLIAVPNISSILEKSKKDQFLADAKKMISLTEYEIRKGNINKPATGQIYKVTLETLATGDVEKDPDGNDYSLTGSYVVIVRKEGYLKYYVSLLSVSSSEKIRGIELTSSESLSDDDRHKLIKDIVKGSSVSVQSIINQLSGDGKIKSVVGNGTVINIE